MALGRAIQGRCLSWWTKSVEILRVEGAERGFDRGAEAGYAVPQIAAKECNPCSGSEKKFWGTNRGGTSGVKLAIKLSALLRGDLVEIFRGHHTPTTANINTPALPMRA